MSLNLCVSALDLDRLGAVAGSRDEAQLASLLERNADRLARHDAYFRSFPGVSTYTPLGEVVSQVVRGRVDPELTPRFQFEHAVALLADSLGEVLDADLFNGADPSFWGEVHTAIRRRLSRAGRSENAWPRIETVLRRGPYLSVPVDPVWPLGSGYLTASEVDVAAEMAAACDLETPDDDDLADLSWPNDAVEAASQYREWLRHAASRRIGLYFHA